MFSSGTQALKMEILPFERRINKFFSKRAR